VIFRTVLFRAIPVTVYKLLYTGTLLSYSIVCYKAYGIPRADVAFIRKAFVDENVQYALLAFWWYVSRHTTISMYADQIGSLRSL
jgi:hypothetical protein